MDVGEIRKNSKLLIDNIPYNVVDAEFVKPGKGRAIYRLKLKNLVDGGTLDRTFHSGEKVDEANITTREMQYLYKESDHYIFMDTQSFEQSFMPEALVGDRKNYLKEGSNVTVVMFGDKPIDLSLAIFVELAVVKTEATGRSDTITAQMKTAVLETGGTVGVPTFIKDGDILKIDTRTGNYIERVTTKK